MALSCSTAVLVCLLIGLAASTDLPCAPREGDPGQGQVCVCNSTYCDTVERPATLAAGLYHRYSTSDATPGFTHTTGSFLQDFTTVDENVTVFTINTEVRYQEIVGFGGSFSVAAGYNLLSLPDGAQEKLVESYFGPTGIEYTFNRLPIGSSDFSTRAYTFDNVSGDVDLQHFSLAEEDYKYKIPFIQRAMNASARNISVYGCAWDAPSWMKTTSLKPNHIQGFIQRQYRRTWAAYHVKFLEAYRDNGIKIWAVSGGNEVVFPLLVGFSLNNTVWYAASQKAWVKNDLMPLLRAAGLEDVKFIGLDDMRIFPIYWMERFADDPEAYTMIDSIGLHWYFDFFAPEMVIFLDWFHQRFPDKRILYTESSINIMFNCNKPLLGSWFRGSAYIYHIIQNLNHWTSGYIDWNLVLDTQGGPTTSMNIDAAVIVNSASGEFYKQPIFYALGHFSKFIPPGARRVDVGQSGNGTADGSDNDPGESFDHLSTEDMLKRYMELRGQAYPTPPPPPGPTQGPHPHPPRPSSLVVPAIVTCLATANPDGSFTAVVANLRNVTSRVRIEDPSVGSITLDMEENSISTFVYWH